MAPRPAAMAAATIRNQMLNCLVVISSVKRLCGVDCLLTRSGREGAYSDLVMSDFSASEFWTRASAGVFAFGGSDEIGLSRADWVAARFNFTVSARTTFGIAALAVRAPALTGSQRRFTLAS